MKTTSVLPGSSSQWPFVPTPSLPWGPERGWGALGLGVRSQPLVWEKDSRRGWGKGRGADLKIQSLPSNFLMFSGRRRAGEAAIHPGSRGSTFLLSLQLEIQAFPYFWLHPVPLQPLDQGQDISLLPLPPPSMKFPGAIGPERTGFTFWSRLGSGRELRFSLMLPP